MSKQILDVCCGGKMFYFDKNDSRVLFCDKRKFRTMLCDCREFSVAPDIVCDFTKLPFDNESYSVVIFDPPHLKGSNKTKDADTGWQLIKYGGLYNGWQEMLAKGFAECFRVLKTNGVLIFKWNETQIKVWIY